MEKTSKADEVALKGLKPGAPDVDVKIDESWKRQLIDEFSAPYMQELRAFLTSVLVSPATSRNWVSWLRAWTSFRLRPGAVLVTKADAPTTTTTTEIAK